jgi:tRNA 2-selenouridine synthase
VAIGFVAAFQSHHVLREIGWHAMRREGGYKAYRHAVLAQLTSLPGAFTYRVICGETGSGKSRLLRALRTAGAQVLDLEHLAKHRGSVLGSLPGEPQPSQKAFDTALWLELCRFDAKRPVFVEAESKRIGSVSLPSVLLDAMRVSACVRLELPFARRIDLLLEEYGHFLQSRDDLFAKLDSLTALHSKAGVETWKKLALAGAWRELTAALLTEHYDPAYRRSTAGNYPLFAETPVTRCDDAGAEGMAGTAAELLKSLVIEKIPA